MIHGITKKFWNISHLTFINALMLLNKADLKNASMILKYTARLSNVVHSQLEIQIENL